MVAVWTNDAMTNIDRIRTAATEEIATVLREQGRVFFTLNQFLRICERFSPPFELCHKAITTLYHDVLGQWCGPPYKPETSWSMVMLAEWATGQQIEGIFGFSHVNGVQFSDPSALTLFVLHD